MSTSTTTNYGWTIPNDDELVKNGAAAIRTLGQAIDTTAAASFGGGLVNIDTTTFTAVSAVSLDDIYSSTYENYFHIIELVGSNGAATNSVRFRTGAGDDSTSNYQYQYIRGNGASITSARAGNQNTLSISSTSTTAMRYYFKVGNPNLSSDTSIAIDMMRSYDDAAGNASEYWLWSGGHNSTTQFTGISLITSTGTITGKVATYGYKL